MNNGVRKYDEVQMFIECYVTLPVKSASRAGAMCEVRLLLATDKRPGVGEGRDREYKRRKERARRRLKRDRGG